MIEEIVKYNEGETYMKTFESGNTVLLVLDVGEDINAALEQFATQYDNRFATISGIGACNFVELNFYDVHERKYDQKVLDEDVELISLMGNLALKEGKPFAHIHGTFGDSQYRTWSGHVSKAIVSVTAEITVVFSDLRISREMNEDIGLYLIP